jgi:hypothetical protein
VGLDRLPEVFAVAAAHGGHDRGAGGAAGADDQLVAPPEAGERQPQLAEAVVFVRVDARLIEDQVRPEFMENLRDVRGEDGEVLFVADAVGQGDVEAAALLAQREIARAVDREGEYFGVIAEDGGG